MKKLILKTLVGVICLSLVSIFAVPQHSEAKYYGNGVYCNKKKCWVDWSKARAAIGKIVVNGWIQHGPWSSH
ncbi:class II bacteriocin [Listeria aquatica]|uniref:class II bacteriocin n=1 Tax=Listeria aquatica TaxID=1494960 RepID=UPI003F710690